MLNLLMFFLGITCIFLIARYNRSNKLFWTLLIAMMSGFVGGTIAANIDNDKQVNVSTVTVDNNSFIADYTNKLDEAVFQEPFVLWKTVTKQHVYADAITFTSVPSKSGFVPGQMLKYIDTS